MMGSSRVRNTCGYSIASVLDKVCVSLLALCPIFQHYKSFFDNAGTVVMVILILYFGFRFLRLKQWYFGTILALTVASIFEIFNHGTGFMEISREMLLLAYFAAAANGAIDLHFYVKAVTSIAMIASYLIIVQYFGYYLLGFHLQLAPSLLLDSSAEQWVALAQTGRIGVTGKLMSLYRPSAFFLEPSHFALYSFPALAAMILSPEFSIKNWFTPALISFGVILSTSGMGIALVFGFWSVFFIRHLMGNGSLKERIRRLFRKNNLIFFAAVVIVLIVLYISVNPFKLSINRIFGIGGSKSAIEGRMGTGITAVSSLSGVEFWFGKKDWGSVHNWNMAGFFYTFYTQGLIGMLLSYGFYIYSLFRTKHAYFWISLVLIGLSFVTIHTHAAFYMLFYVIILMNGHAGSKRSGYKDIFLLSNPFYRYINKFPN